MKTSGGKSRIYQIAGLYGKGITIVFMPLISLMQDALTFLKSKHISCCSLSPATFDIDPNKLEEMD